MRASPRIVLSAAALLVGAAAAPQSRAQSRPDAPPPIGWSGQVSMGLRVMPDFEGSRTTRSGLAPDVDVVYRTEAYGQVKAGGHGLSWEFVDRPDWSLGVGLGWDPGRGEGRSGVLRPGSPRLAGMGGIASTPVVSVSGAYRGAGLPLNFSLQRATQSYRGTVLDVGSEVPWRLASRTTLLLSTGLTWADRRYEPAFFGVDEAQSAATGRPRFDAHAGLKSAQLGVGLDFALDRHWHVGASVQYKRLLGDAADSPVVERKSQPSGGLQLAYRY